MKNQLGFTTVVCVYDQAIYVKAYQIKCKEPRKFESLFPMMGVFHVILNFLAVIAARFKDAVLKDIQSSTVAEGYADTMFLVPVLINEPSEFIRYYMRHFINYWKVLIMKTMRLKTC